MYSEYVKSCMVGSIFCSNQIKCVCLWYSAVVVSDAVVRLHIQWCIDQRITRVSC